MQNNEVKEILDRLNIPMNKSCACCLEDYECKTLLDYITNLQEENETLKNELEWYRKECYKLVKNEYRFRNLN